MNRWKIGEFQQENGNNEKLFLLKIRILISNEEFFKRTHELRRHSWEKNQWTGRQVNRNFKLNTKRKMSEKENQIIQNLEIISNGLAYM
jgi:hypothetical protein